MKGVACRSGVYGCVAIGRFGCSCRDRRPEWLSRVDYQVSGKTLTSPVGATWDLAPEPLASASGQVVKVRLWR